MAPGVDSQRPRFSVVIPAHNEAAVVVRCLQFLGDLDAGEAEVAVVANGCSDATARLASAISGVRVVELAQASKAAALNAGEQAVQAFPRVYLDADIVVGAEVLRRLVALLADLPAAVGAPEADLVTTGRPVVVRMFYAAYARLPYLQNGMTGLGLYALNEAGRSRFTTFPDLTGDDLYVQRLFDQNERHTLVGATFAVEVPWTLASLMAVRTRVAFGNAELATAGLSGGARSTRGTVRALLRIILREPTMLPACVVYSVVTALSRSAARRRTIHRWPRDDTSRDRPLK